ncbi:MAG TPA: glycogen debranching protein GlgX [Steroidobacteraceae bacterium]|nr:glycogen debranching protein GlgX [Steroidobacteraceae bacterium]
MKLIHAGSPRPLGATLSERGVNFALFSSHATRVELCLFDSVSGAEIARHDMPGQSGEIWHGLLPARQAAPGTLYAYCVHGANQPENGQRFDATVPLIDPYAYALSKQWPLRSQVIDHAFDWGGDRPPTIPWRDSVIYELHVKGLTKLHPAVAEQWRGKYLGLSVGPVIQHLKSIGVTAVELLPCQAFVSEQFLRERQLSNYWGYNQIAWFAPANEYAVADAVVEFKTMVKALHAAGIEVIMDVVFNHTAEGGEAGPLLSLRGIDNPVYYRLTPGDLRGYENLTGTGNTVNCEHPRVRALIIDCLKYWVEEMHVDGFRFDLATVLARDANGFNAHAAFFKALRAEPALAYVKLIAEPWDVGWGGYQLGHFPPGWSEWNDRYRNAARSFWRGDAGKVGEFAERFAGSSDVFRHDGRKPSAGINFVAAHDGMTLLDLVSYNERHNEANLENNRDGNSGELSFNCGVEGPTADAAIVSLRKRQIRNLLASLFLSQGVPMLQAGDEFGRTQRGNNNAYCQDNEISWVDWRMRSVNHDLLEFVQLLARLRRLHVEFRRETFLKGAASRAAVKDVTWLNARGSEMTQADWQDANLRTLGVWFGEQSGSVEHLLLLVNSADSPLQFSLPAAPASGPWIRLFDTALAGVGATSLGTAQTYAMNSHSAALLEC